MNGRRWSKEEDATLKRMWEAGQSSVAIGARLSRPPTSVRRRVGILNLGRRDDLERERLAAIGRRKLSMRPLYQEGLEEKTQRIKNHFAALADRLRVLEEESDQLARDLAGL